MPPLQFVNLQGIPILEQLKWEEALLRVDHQNWCLFNYDSPPAIVMGISGQLDKLVDQKKLLSYPYPLQVIRRFSGGGTVVIDQKTIFVTFIFNSSALEITPYPQQIMSWTEKIYQPIFKNLPFSLRENDYVLGEKKIGGNAQSITKNRWLHHSSFLFDFNPKLMELLLHPPKTPAYRQKRTHTDFLSRLCHHWPSIEHFQQDFVKSLQSHFSLNLVKQQEVELIACLPHRQTTIVLN